MLISKSRYLSLFNVFFFSTKYFIIFGKVADQGHRRLARTKDHILYCTFNIPGRCAKGLSSNHGRKRRYSCLWVAVILLYIWIFLLALLDLVAAFFCMIAPLFIASRIQKRELFSNRAAIAAILMDRLTWEAGVGLPWVPEIFSRLWRGASSAAGRHVFGFGLRHERRSREKKPLAQSALIYRARWTLTLSLICQSDRRSQDC